MIPAMRRELAWAYVAMTSRRRFTPRGSYMAAAGAAVRSKADRLLGTDGCCEGEVTAFWDPPCDCQACLLSHGEWHDKVVARLARWLKWRDQRFGFSEQPDIPTTKRARTKRLRELRKMRAWCEAELVRLDAAMEER